MLDRRAATRWHSRRCDAKAACALGSWLIGAAYLLVLIGGFGTSAAERGKQNALRGLGLTEEQGNVMSWIAGQPGMTEAQTMERLRVAGQDDIVKALARTASSG